MKNIFVIVITMALAGVLTLFAGAGREYTGQKKKYLSSPKEKFSAGSYIGTGKGFAGKIKVKVIFSKKSSTEPVIMTGIEVVQNSEIKNYWSKVEKKVLPYIVEKGTSQIDAKTGATKSVRGLIEAIEDAKRQSYRGNKSSTY